MGHDLLLLALGEVLIDFLTRFLEGNAQDAGGVPKPVKTPYLSCLVEGGSTAG